MVKIITGILFIIGCALFGYYIWNDLSSVAPSPISPTPTSTPVSVIGVETTGTSPKGTAQPPNTSVPIPDLNRPIDFSGATMSLNIQKKARESVLSLESALKGNSDDFGSWIDLGLERSSYGDYEGARQAWEYASAIRPKNSVSFGNLGFLYGYQLHDSVKAEKNYLQAIGNDAALSYLYLQTSEFYRDVLKDTAKAKGILQQGLIRLPNSPELQSALNALSSTH